MTNEAGPQFSPGKRIERYLARVLAGSAALLRGHARNYPSPQRNVAVVCNSFLRYGCEQAIGLSAHGIAVTLYYVDRLDDFSGSAADRDQYLDRARNSGVTCVAIPTRRLARIIPDIVALHRAIRSGQYDRLIVHAHVDPRFVFLAYQFPVALFVHDPAPHSGDYESLFRWPLRAIARVSEATAAVVLVHSQALAEQLSHWIDPARVGVVPHGARISRQAPPLLSPPRLLLVGRLMRYKGIDTALNAFAEIRKSRPDCELVIAGRGDMAGITDTPFPTGVTLIERYVSETELDDLFRSARLVLLPYRDASQSGVGLLSVGLGVPCVVTRTGALPDLIPPGHERQVVPPSDPAALAAAVLEALDHDEAHRRATVDYAARVYAWPVTAREALNEIARVLDRR